VLFVSEFMKQKYIKNRHSVMLLAFYPLFHCIFVTYFQIRMGAISQTNVNFVGSHCGVSIGEDGPSQMGLEDIALFRSIPGMYTSYRIWFGYIINKRL
jgi:transketolase